MCSGKHDSQLNLQDKQFNFIWSSFGSCLVIPFQGKN